MSVPESMMPQGVEQMPQGVEHSGQPKSERPKTRSEAVRGGWVKVGGWGWDHDRQGAVWCRPEDLAAARTAYDLVEEGGVSPDALDGVAAAGGVFVAE
jgi:hypothetical protein